MNEYIYNAIKTADEERHVVGYAAVFNDPAVLFKDGDGNEYKEVFVPGCFDEANMNDIVFRYNHHDSFTILARTANGSLRTNVDETGLHIEAVIADTTQGNDVFTLIKRNDIAKMSLAFTVKEDRYDVETRTRYITKIDKVFDVSAVDVPAYPNTSLEPYKTGFTAAEEDIRNTIYILSQT